MARSVLLLIALLPTPAFGWNALGHKVVCEIAWRELEPATRESIVDTLRRHPRFDADFAAATRRFKAMDLSACGDFTT
jgi:hypothetical protein